MTERIKMILSKWIGPDKCDRLAVYQVIAAKIYSVPAVISAVCC